MFTLIHTNGGHYGGGRMYRMEEIEAFIRNQMWTSVFLVGPDGRTVTLASPAASYSYNAIGFKNGIIGHSVTELIIRSAKSLFQNDLRTAEAFTGQQSRVWEELRAGNTDHAATEHSIRLGERGRLVTVEFHRILSDGDTLGYVVIISKAPLTESQYQSLERRSRIIYPDLTDLAA